MPQLEWNSAPSENRADTRWGRGMEQFSFWYVDGAVKQWYSQHRLPPIVTPESLASAPPKAIALLRDISFHQQADTLKVENPQDRMSLLTEMGLGRVSDVFTEPNDGGRTTDYVIPIESGGGGQVQIVVNAAWGVHWRLSADHPLVKDFPQLGITHSPDLSTPPEHDPKAWGYKPFLAPEVLAQATDPAIIDTAQFAQDLRGLVADMQANPGTAVKNSGWSLGLVQDDHTSSLDIQHDAHQIHAGISLHLGHDMGVKQVGIYGYFDPKTEGISAEIAQKARSLDQRWDLLHRYVYERDSA